jgi:ATP-binding cassette, subfamily B, bacterial
VTGYIRALVRRSVQTLRLRIRLLRILVEATPAGTAAFSAVNLVIAAIPVATAVTTGALIDAVTHLHPARPGAPASLAPVVPPAIAFALVLAVSHALWPLYTVVQTWVARCVDNWVRATVFTSLAAPADIEHLENDTVLSEANRLLAGEFGAFSLGRLTTGSLSVIAQYIGTASATVVVMRVSVVLGLLLALGVVTVRRSFIAAGASIVPAMEAVFKRYRRAWYYRDLCETAALGKEVRVYGLGHWLVSRFGDEWEAGAGPWRRWQVRSWVIMSPLFAFVAAIDAGTYAWLGASAAAGGLSIGRMTTALTAARSMGFVSGEDSQRDAYSTRAVKALDSMHALAAAGPTVATPTDAAGMPAHEIRFSGVAYAYPSGVQAIQGLDLVLRAGQSTAIVGPNGAGKTTLIKLLTALATPQSGEILVDGHRLGDIDVAAWRAQLAVIFQDFTRYELSFEDNVRCLRRDAGGDSRAALQRAVDRAGATEVLDSLPASWETQLSRQFEGGAELSGGQWQKVALARAFYAVERGASVLVLDEPTAALDVKAEAALFERFLDLTQGLTTVLLSHRFSTVRHAQNIIVLDEGKVVEEGSHPDLLDHNGLYAGMFRVQAERFGVATA